MGGEDKTASKTDARSKTDHTRRDITVPDDFNAFNDECEQRGWSDGLPLVPPTVARVEAMLAATKRDRNEIVAHIAPGFGAATVERIAINAVMAGCRPEYLPVLLAAVEAVADEKFNLQGIQATTNPAAPWIIVNGPLAATLGVNAGLNCLGQGNRANATLGRALRLVLQNIGGALPGQMDRATHGQPGKYTFCCAENEAASPWQPLHVERGFNADENVVTVVGAAGTLNMNSHSKDAADLLRAIALKSRLSDQQRLSLRRRAVGDPVARARGSSAARRLVQGRRQARHLGAIKNGGRPVRAQGLRPREAHARKGTRRILGRYPGADSARAGRHRDHRRRRAGHAFGLRADVRPDARGVAQS